MAQKKSVDEIWRELNARPAPRIGTSGGITSMPGITSITRTVPKAKPSLAAEAAVEDVPLNSGAEAARRAAASYDPTKAGISPEDLTAYVATMQRTINCLSDPDRATRRQAAVTIQTKLTKGDAATPAASPAMLQAVVCGPLLFPLVSMTHDVVEKSRAVAVELLGHAARTIADLSPLLPVLMPELLKRMGHLPVVEPAEEIRLGLTQLVAAVVHRTEPRVMATYAADVCMFLCRAMEDGYHEIKKVGCSCAAELAARVPADVLSQHTEKLLATLLANLNHQHSRVRVAVVEALVGLVGRGAVPPGSVQSVVAPGVRPIAHDRAPAVREALFEALAFWLGAGPPKGSDGRLGGEAVSPAFARAYAADLMPILLIGVTDTQPPVATLALSLLEAVGAAWHKHFGLGTSSAAATQGSAGSDVEMAEGSSGGAQADEVDTGRSAAVLASQLGAPYTGRPGEGARSMARVLLPALLPPAIKELGEWTVVQRACAARSLHTMLVLAEDGATEHLPALLPALCTCVGDEDAEVAGYVVRTVHVLGAHVAARRWLPLTLDHLSNAKLSTAQRTNTLVVLSGLLHAAGLAQQALPEDLIAALGSALASDEVRGSSDSAPARQQLLAVVTNVLRWAGAKCGGISMQLYTLLLQLLGHERDAARKAAITDVMQQCAQACGVGSWEVLAEQYAEVLLEAVSADAAKWSAESSNFLVLRALLLTAGPSTLSRLAPRVFGLLKPVLGDQEADAQLRLGALQLVDELLEDTRRGVALAGENAAGLLDSVLLPPLVWRAGKTAAAVRFAAVTALVTLLRNKLVGRKPLLARINDGTLLPIVAQELDEDWYVDVRNAACYVAEQLLLLVGPRLGHEPRRAMYPELLKRLDDSSNQVRIAACRALTAFCTTMALDYCETNSGYLAADVIIHMDDSDLGVQEAACAVLEALAVKKPDAVRAEVNKVLERFRSKHYCHRVLAACNAPPQAPAAGVAGDDEEMDAA